MTKATQTNFKLLLTNCILIKTRFETQIEIFLQTLKISKISTATAFFCENVDKCKFTDTRVLESKNAQN